MARIDVLPSIEIIRGLKGILDFYVWKGLPCVRAWPRYRPARQSAASLAAALLFGAIVKAYNLVGDDALTAYRQDALDQPRTARDIYVTGVFGNLHEASMSDFLTLLTQCRDFLSDLTALLNALDSIDTDELVVNVDQSVLPPLAATSTHQATQITALQNIDDLQDALESAALDRLLIRGMDQLFSFRGVLVSTRNGPISGAGGFFDSDTPAAGSIWCVTNLSTVDATTATTVHKHLLRAGAVEYAFGETRAAIGIGQWTFWGGLKFLAPGDVVRTYFTGGLGGDACYVHLTGFRMTLET